MVWDFSWKIFLFLSLLFGIVFSALDDACKPDLKETNCTSIPNTVCILGHCICKRGYYKETAHDGNLTCKQTLPLDGLCTFEGQCQAIYRCFEGKCSCRHGYFRVDATCEPRVVDIIHHNGFDSDHSKVLIVVLSAIGTITLKVALIYLIAKLFCFNRATRTYYEDEETSQVPTDYQETKMSEPAVIITQPSSERASPVPNTMICGDLDSNEDHSISDKNASQTTKSPKKS